jgi:NAD(P)-dependent dehydrogenase (short-subunit alcohol dehydrogenase family)
MLGSTVMRVRDKIVVVTGGGHGIGAAMSRRFAAEGAAAVVVADLDATAADAVAADVARAGSAGRSERVDVARAAQLRELVARTLDEFGRVDLFCSNAGIATGRGVDAPTGVWSAAWTVNVMAHVHAAQAVLPSMLERGEGYLLQTCSAAGLLTSPGDAPYAVTKHAAVAFAEWLAMTYGDQGIRVSALCPQGVRTRLLMDSVDQRHPAGLAVLAAGTLLEPEQVAQAVVVGLDAERFLVLPHPEVAEYVRQKAADPDRWIAGVRRLLLRKPAG